MGGDHSGETISCDITFTPLSMNILAAFIIVIYSLVRKGMEEVKWYYFQACANRSGHKTTTNTFLSTKLEQGAFHMMLPLVSSWFYKASIMVPAVEMRRQRSGDTSLPGTTSPASVKPKSLWTPRRYSFFCMAPPLGSKISSCNCLYPICMLKTFQNSCILINTY